MKKINELRELTADELTKELLVQRKEQLNLRIKQTHGSLDKTHLIRQIRRNIARIKTIMTEKVEKHHAE